MLFHSLQEKPNPDEDGVPLSQPHQFQGVRQRVPGRGKVSLKVLKRSQSGQRKTSFKQQNKANNFIWTFKENMINNLFF